MRTIATKSLREYETRLLEGLDSGELRRTYREVSQERGEFAAVAGQISGLVNDIRSVQQIIDDIIAEAAKLTDELQRTKTTEGNQ